MQITIDNKIYETHQLSNGKWTLPDEIKEMLSITCGALNIDGNRVATSEKLGQESGFIRRGRTDEEVFMGNDKDRPKGIYKEVSGRYPAQAFLTNTEDILDEQSGVLKSGAINPYEEKGGSWFTNHKIRNYKSESNTGGCSKVLHKCPYETEEYDLFNYCPKVSKSERNAGCEEMEEKFKAGVDFRPNHTEKALKGETGNPYGRWGKITNNHPTVKPISLNEKILRLFKTPNEQKILISFAGSGSEVIGAIKAGFKNIEGCEINEEYVKIAEARIDYWTKKFKEDSSQQTLL